MIERPQWTIDYIKLHKNPVPKIQWVIQREPGDWEPWVDTQTILYESSDSERPFLIGRTILEFGSRLIRRTQLTELNRVQQMGGDIQVRYRDARKNEYYSTILAFQPIGQIRLEVFLQLPIKNAPDLDYDDPTGAG